MEANWHIPPRTRKEQFSELVQGVSVHDPYRWLEDQNSPETHHWLIQQNEYYERYLGKIGERQRIRNEVAELLAYSSSSSFLKVGERYFYRRRECNQEQACIYLRDGAEGVERRILDPLTLRSGGIFTSVDICAVADDGNLLAYQVRSGGEEPYRVEMIEVNTGHTLCDGLPHGVLHGFAFCADGAAFFYAHQPSGSSSCQEICKHVIGTPAESDELVFRANDGGDVSFRCDTKRMVIVVVRHGDPTSIDFLLLDLQDNSLRPLFRSRDGIWIPLLFAGRIFALTFEGCPGGRIVELLPEDAGEASMRNFIMPREGSIANVVVMTNLLAVAYSGQPGTEVVFYDDHGQATKTFEFSDLFTVRILGQQVPCDELFYESESINSAPSVYRYLPDAGRSVAWDERAPLPGAEKFAVRRHSCVSADGMAIPMMLFGRKDSLGTAGSAPAVLTSYGGFGISTTPQFSVLATWLMKQGCILALPGIRGGSEFGAGWHEAARRRGRQKSFDDFLAAAQWLVETGTADRSRIGAFGGSNSGLLVLAAVTQRPELFSACLCIAPLLDMLRYHLFDQARKWQDEFGTAEDPEDFRALHAYSPYHNVREGAEYPAILFVSGPADGRCNPLHVRKMVARLQAASGSRRPILLDWNEHRGHMPVLPLSMRIEALTNRLAFFARELGLNCREASNAVA